MRNLVLGGSLALFAVLVGQHRTSATTKGCQSELYYEEGPNLYSPGDLVELKVNILKSPTQPYSLEYYHFPFCKPLDGVKTADLHIEDYLAGDRPSLSPYKIEMGIEKMCEPLCETSLLGQDKTDPNGIFEAIQKGYYHRWTLDGLPAAIRNQDNFHSYTMYSGGVPMGYVSTDTGTVYINNHVNIEIRFRPSEETAGKFEITRFTVESLSIKHDYDIGEEIYAHGESNILIKGPTDSCKPQQGGDATHTTYRQAAADGVEPQPASGAVIFTYDVKWVQYDSIPWSNRWDIYLTDGDVDAFHLQPLVNFQLGSMGFCMLLACIIGTKVRRLLKGKQYQALASTDGASDNSSNGVGIHALHEEVFRAPSNAPRLLFLFCGSGVHLWTTIVMTTAVLMQTRWNPEHLRATVIRISIVAFSLGGFANGLTTAWSILAFFGQTPAVYRSVVCFPLVLPIVVFACYDLLNLYAWIKGGSSVPFVHLHHDVLVWFTVSTPIALLGSYFGFHYSSGYEASPVSDSVRPIPKQPLHMRLPLVMLLGGMPLFISSGPWLVMLIRLLWLGVYDLNIGWYLLSLITTSVMASLICTILMLLQFQKGNHQWWWRAFFIGGSPHLYAFVLLLVATKKVGLSPGICHLLVLCGFGALLTGTASVFGCLFFNTMFFRRCKSMASIE